MPKLGDMLTSNYLKASDCDEADLILTISTVKQEVLGRGAEAQDKWVLYFNEVKKGLVLNVTNTKAIAKIHGDDTDEWEGKKIALYATEVEFGGETMLGIRVRLKAPKGKAGGAKLTDPVEPAVGSDETPF